MTEPQPIEKVDPETLVLRAKPRKVVRFKKKLLIGAAAVGAVGIIAVAWLGLRSPVHVPAPQKELYDPDNANDAQKAKPDRLQALPKSYADVPDGVPVLGPPLPGDLGRPILEHQQAQIAGGAQQSVGAMSAGTVAPASSEQPLRHDSGLFFQSGQHAAADTPSAVVSVEPPATSMPTPAAGADKGANQNGQAHKLQFVAMKSSGTENSHGLQQPASPYQVMAGTVISASLITGVNSDLPGMVIAQVTEPVFDTVTGKILLVPQGSRLIGEYDSVVAFGQSRALLVWKRLVLPNGSSLEIDNLPATDASGYAGLKDSVDFHTSSLLKGVGLSTMLGLTATGSDSEESDLVKAFREATRETANQAGQRIVDKMLEVQPTLTVRPGWPLRVIVHKDLTLQPYVQ